MGLFDIFKGKPAKSATSGSGGSSGDKKPGEKRPGEKKAGERRPNAAAKYAEAAGSKRAQNYDRQEAINELCKMKAADAVEALLRRFTFATDPWITDQ